MTEKQAVMDALQRLPGDASIEEITEELRIMASIRRGRADITSGRTKSQEEAERLLEILGNRMDFKIIWSDAAIADVHDIHPLTHKKQRELRKFALRFDSSKKRFEIFTRERWRLY